MSELGKKLSRALKPDAQPFDKIVIETIPRYKQSELSGDEWRISAQCTFFRKGKEVHSFGASTVQYAAYLVGARHIEACDDAKGFFAGEDNTCDQEGCSEQATWIHKKKFNYEKHTGQKNTYQYPEFRLFCDRHQRRGDCGIDDADSNYDKSKLDISGSHNGTSK